MTSSVLLPTTSKEFGTQVQVDSESEMRFNVVYHRTKRLSHERVIKSYGRKKFGKVAANQE